MLKLCGKGHYLSTAELAPDEDRALRRAFGRFATVDARKAGADVVQRFQHEGAGHWFACDCLEGLVGRPPVLVLVPVVESYIRRHTEPPLHAHAENCDFFREPAEQPPSPKVLARHLRGHCAWLDGTAKLTVRPQSARFTEAMPGAGKAWLRCFAYYRSTRD